MYYMLILISVAMFGGCFALNDAYRSLRSSSMESSIESSFVGSVAGLVVLLAVSGFHLEATAFTLLMALLSAVNGILFMFCSFKALDSANLSLYSLFSMLGGMALPFFQGIAFYGEKMNLGKLICFALICVSLILTVSQGKSKNGTKYYIAVFILNGMSGVLSKIFTASTLPITSAEWYSIWIAFFTAAISGIIWLTVFRKKRTAGYGLKAFLISAGNGTLNRVANFMLVVALAHIDASVQYPAVTGGVIIISTVISLFGKNKPSKKEILSVFIAFAAMMILFLTQ